MSCKDIKSNRTKYTNQTRKRVHELATKMSIKEISIKMKIPKSTVRNWLVKKRVSKQVTIFTKKKRQKQKSLTLAQKRVFTTYGINEAPLNVNPFSDDNDKLPMDVSKLYIEDAAMSQIPKQQELSAQSINRVFQKVKVAPYKTKKELQSKAIKMALQGFSTQYSSEALGKRITTIERWLEENQITSERIQVENEKWVNSLFL